MTVGTFVGVSSIYLLVGEHTGLVGLGLFLLTLAAVLMLVGVGGVLLLRRRMARW